jgi:molybdate transport system substrate-binding protein
MWFYANCSICQARRVELRSMDYFAIAKGYMPFRKCLFLKKSALIVLITLSMVMPSRPDTVRLYAAGSLKAALTDVAKAYEARGPNKIEAKYGPSGLLKNEIATGAKADVFASANMEHPQALHSEKKGGPIVRFARNKLCALVTPELRVDNATLLERMLDPNVKVGTSTPKSDPSGDYAFQVFAKAEMIKPGARATLENKALQLTGGANSAMPPPGRTVYGWHVAERHADVFLTYCTNARAAQKENPGQQIVQLPDNLSVGADYGVTVIVGSSPAAQQFVDFITSSAGQEILVGYGFTPGK